MSGGFARDDVDCVSGPAERLCELRSKNAFPDHDFVRSQFDLQLAAAAARKHQCNGLTFRALLRLREGLFETGHVEGRQRMAIVVVLDPAIRVNDPRASSL